MLKTFVNMLITPKLRALHMKTVEQIAAHQEIFKVFYAKKASYYMNRVSGALHCFAGLKIISR
jgi:hypothetical protein